MKEDIIRMAREAGLHLATDVNWMPIIGIEYAERFAALVAAAEREKLAQHFEQSNEAGIHSAWVAAAIRANDPMPLFDDWDKDWTK